MAYLEQPEIRYRKKFPLPSPVAKVIAEALFTSVPKPRYIVGTIQELNEVIDRLLTLVYEVNESYPGGLSEEELVTKLHRLDSS